jgi:hypothetical protein
MIVLKRIGTISGERSKREINRAWFATRTALGSARKLKNQADRKNAGIESGISWARREAVALRFGRD